MHPCFSGKIDHRSDPLHEYLTTYLLHRRTRKLLTKDHKRERGVVNTADLGLKLVVKSSDYSTTRDPQQLQSDEEERVWSWRMMEESEKQLDSSKMRRRSLFSACLECMELKQGSKFLPHLAEFKVLR